MTNRILVRLLRPVLVSVIVLLFIVLTKLTMDRYFGLEKQNRSPRPLRIKKLKVVIRDGYEYFAYTDIPTLTKGTNEARVGDEKCLPEPHIETDNQLAMVVVTNYIPVDTMRHKHAIYNSRNATDEEEAARKYEIITSYQANLLHPYVKSLHIFVEHYSSLLFLQQIDLENSEKLVIHWIRKTITVPDKLSYISRCLQDHIVAVIHQDNRIGIGFEKLNQTILRDNKIMYALTRHTPYKTYCAHVNAQNRHCDPKLYQGSHDAFVFHVKRTLSGYSLNTTLGAVEGNELGMEQLFIWHFRRNLGYKVLNPCLVLHIHHEHCVPIRKAHRKEVNKEPQRKVWEMAQCTDKLE